MSTNKLRIGRLPVFKGQYVAGVFYKRLHRVTHLGSEFQAKVDGQLQAPVVLTDNQQTPVWNDAEWDIVSNGTDALVIANTVNRVFTITETAWADLQANTTQYEYFCRNHIGWAVDVVEDGYMPPTPDQDESSVITADGVLTMSATIQADGTLILNGTITADGILTL